MNKNALIIGLAVIMLGIIIVVIGIIPGFNILGASGRYVLTTSYPVVNDSYPAYKTVPPNITDEEVKRIGNLFGLSGNIEESVPSIGEVQIVDDTKKPTSRLLFYLNSGAYRYDIPEKYYSYTTDTQPDLPSDEEARVIATKYLLERDLLPDDVHFKEVSIGSQYGHKTLDTYTLYTLTKHVSFVKEIHGLRVYNAGVGVTIGDKNEIVGAGNSLREFNSEPVRNVKIVTPEQAYQRLLSNDFVIQPLSEDYDRIVISNISLGYWMDIKTYPQEYILPVYAFSCVTGRGDETEQVMRYVSAVDSSEMQYFT